MCQLRTYKTSVSEIRHTDLHVFLLSCAPEPVTSFSPLSRVCERSQVTVKCGLHTVVGNLQFSVGFPHKNS